MRLPALRPAAAADVEDAFRWYEGQRTGLGAEFLGAVRTSLSTIAENPELHPVVHRQTRRALIRRFPYAIYYRVIDGEPVVVACFHGKRSPRVWRRR